MEGWGYGLQATHQAGIRLGGGPGCGGGEEHREGFMPERMCELPRRKKGEEHSVSRPVLRAGLWYSMWEQRRVSDQLGAQSKDRETKCQVLNTSGRAAAWIEGACAAGARPHQRGLLDRKLQLRHVLPSRLHSPPWPRYQVALMPLRLHSAAALLLGRCPCQAGSAGQEDLAACNAAAAAIAAAIAAVVGAWAGSQVGHGCRRVGGRRVCHHQGRLCQRLRHRLRDTKLVGRPCLRLAGTAWPLIAAAAAAIATLLRAMVHKQQRLGVALPAGPPRAAAVQQQREVLRQQAAPGGLSQRSKVLWRHAAAPPARRGVKRRAASEGLEVGLEVPTAPAAHVRCCGTLMNTGGEHGGESILCPAPSVWDTVLERCCIPMTAIKRCVRV